MIKEALEHILNLKKPEIVTVDERNYSLDKLNPVYEPEIKTLNVNSLCSMVDYIVSDVDSNENPCIIHVESPTVVSLRSAVFGDFSQRETMLQANALVPGFTFGQWYDNESFIIALQSKFQVTPDLQTILAVVGNVTDGSVRTYGDDGVSQTVQAKVGVAKVADVAVPNPVLLQPYRTFVEVEQPASHFVFRMRSGRETPEMALFEADGGAWKNKAMLNIRGYFEDKLKTQIADGQIVLIS